MKDEILPNEFKSKMDNWAFGCDVCQDVCPWNRFTKATNEKRLSNPKLLDLSKKEWQEMSKEFYDELFKRSAVKRTKYKGLKRNIVFLKTPTKQ